MPQFWAPSVLSLAVLIAMGACAAPSDDSTARQTESGITGPTDELEPTPTAPATTVEPTTRSIDLTVTPKPDPLFDLSCDEVVPIERVRALYGADASPVDLSFASVDRYGLSATAAVTEGALSCHWTAGGAELPVMSLTATIAGPAEYAISYSSFSEISDSDPPVPWEEGRATCFERPAASGPNTVRCDWSVYGGGIWAVARFADLPLSEVFSPIDEFGQKTREASWASPSALSTQMLSDALGALARAGAAQPGSVDQLISCEALFASTALTAEVGQTTWVNDTSAFTANDRYSTTAQIGGEVGALGIERLGWTECLASAPAVDGVSITIARGAAWIVAEENAPSGGYITEGHITREGADRALSGCSADSNACSYALAVGDDLIAVSLYGADLGEAKIVAGAVATVIG